MVDENGKEIARKQLGSTASTKMDIRVLPQDGPPGDPATLEITASGLLDYYQRSIWGGVPAKSAIAIDYSLSGGATGPTSVPVAETLSLPIRRGATDGQISARFVRPEEK